MPRRKRSGVVDLPAGVHAVPASNGKIYYYWHPNRGTAYAGDRVSLGSDPKDPKFWQKLRELGAPFDGGGDEIKPGTFAALIIEYRGSPDETGQYPNGSAEWNKNSRETKSDYSLYLDRIRQTWGHLPVKALSAPDIYALRKPYESTPVAANHLVSVLRTLLGFGIPRKYIDRNPALEVRAIEITNQQNARPWPEWAYKLTLEQAPEHIRRAAFLGRTTGQRRSDLVKLGRKHRDRDGLLFKVGKLRNKNHFLPLTAAEIAEIDSWSCSDTGPWIVSPAGKAMTGDHLGSSLDRFLAKVPQLADLEGLSPHGWRAMAVCDRRLRGLKHQEIAAELCMSLPMVMRYSKHVDQEALARRARDKREQKGVGL